MRDVCVEGLAVKPDGLYIDGTCGGGGHSAVIAEQLGEGGALLALDRDPAAVSAATSRLQAYGAKVAVSHARFADWPAALEASPFSGRPIAGFLLDLGVSSPQLDRAERGFSFMNDGPLDMRMDPTRGPTAAEYLSRVTQEELRRVLRELGDVRSAGRLARVILERHRREPLTRTGELAALVVSVVGRAPRERIHPATRVFQALRMAVNEELEELLRALEAAPERLASGGRVVVISFHSGEDRVVKRFLQREARGCNCPPSAPVCICGRQPTVRILTRRPLRPTDEEVARNPRARSARVRMGERL